MMAASGMFTVARRRVMTRPAVLLFLTLFTLPSHAQPPGGAKTIEGYWQDTARRILFSRNAPPGYVYGQWTALDQAQTYPSAKHVRRSASGFELADLLYDEQEAIKISRASDRSIDFTRTNRSSTCTVEHRCDVDGDQMLCRLRTMCPEKDIQALLWEGEERYARRASCERTQSKPEAQGIPSVCR
jgi:hypothetical protein